MPELNDLPSPDPLEPLTGFLPPLPPPATFLPAPMLSALSGISSTFSLHSPASLSSPPSFPLAALRAESAARVGHAFMNLVYALRLNSQPGELDSLQADLDAAREEYEAIAIDEKIAAQEVSRD